MQVRQILFLVTETTENGDHLLDWSFGSVWSPLAQYTSQVSFCFTSVSTAKISKGTKIKCLNINLSWNCGSFNLAKGMQNEILTSVSWVKCSRFVSGKVLKHLQCVWTEDGRGTALELPRLELWGADAHEEMENTAPKSACTRVCALPPLHPLPEQWLSKRLKQQRDCWEAWTQPSIQATAQRCYIR